METSAKQKRRFRRPVATFLICLIIIAAGAALANHLNKTAPKANKRPPTQTAPRVETLVLQPVDQRVAITAMGSVVPAREMVLKPRVGERGTGHAKHLN
jgi:multidrug efflux pump subunit AcrA (membrane-fusion protein)